MFVDAVISSWQYLRQQNQTALQFVAHLLQFIAYSILFAQLSHSPLVIFPLKALQIQLNQVFLPQTFAYSSYNAILLIRKAASSPPAAFRPFIQSLILQKEIKMATLRDVAKLANVDVSTVSRALNNSSYVHPDTKKKILEAVKTLSYQPNVLARGLRQGKRNTLGIVVPKLNYSIFAAVVSGIESEARKNNYVTLMCNTGNDKDVEKEALNRLRNGFIDALIIAGTGGNTRLTRSIAAEGMPVIQVIRNFDPSLSSVVINYESIGYQSVRLLAEKGCRSIGLINGSMKIPPYADRYKGYKRAIAELGIAEITAERESMQRGVRYGYDCAVRLIDENSRLDAILAATDTQALGAIRALYDNGLSVPGDVRVLSMTGNRIGDMNIPSITSMEMPAFEIGERATDMALGMLSGDHKGLPSIQHLSFQARLVERESTA